MKRKNGSRVVVVGYWALATDEATSVHYDIKVEALLADMIIGDLAISAQLRYSLILIAVQKGFCLVIFY